MPAREIDALRRVGVARQEVQALVRLRIDRAEAAIGGHGIEEARRRIGVVPRLAQHADADHVGLQFLIAREGGKAQLAAGKRLLAGKIGGEHLGDDAARNHLRLLALLALDAVIGRHMRHLVREHGGHFRGVVGERQQAAGHVEIAARKRESVDCRRVENGDAVGLLRVFRNRRQGAGDPGDQPLGLGVAVFSAVARHDAWMLARAELGPRVVLLHFLDDLRIGGWRNGGLVGLLDHGLAASQQRRGSQCDQRSCANGSMPPRKPAIHDCLPYHASARPHPPARPAARSHSSQSAKSPTFSAGCGAPARVFQPGFCCIRFQRRLPSRPQ